MQTYLIACGNPLRGDDGVAHAALRLVPPASNRRVLAVRQWTPELAEEIAGADRVVFLDADTENALVTIEPIRGAGPHSPLTHALYARRNRDSVRSAFRFHRPGISLPHPGT